MQHTTTTLTPAFNPYHFSHFSKKEKNSAAHYALATEDFLDSRSFTDANENALLMLTSFFEESKVLKTLSYTFVPAGKLYISDRVILKFSLADGYQSHFVLLRGLLGFGKPPHVLVVAEPVDKTFVIEVTSEYVESVVTYFQKVFTWLAREIKFKAALKKVIQLQEEAKKIQQEAYEGLYASVA